MPECPTSAWLPRLLSEQLTGAEHEAIEAHLEGCAACQEELERLTDSVPGGRPRSAPAVFPGQEAFWLRFLELAPPAAASTFAGQTLPVEGTNGSSPTAREVLPGYQLLEELGRGATGVVYKARRLCADQLVAVKVLRCRPDGDNLVRFRREIEALVWLNHPHIVRIHEIGEHLRRPFFAMEYVSGGSLQRHLSGRSLSIVQALSLVAALARAVQAAHEHAIIHRDLKPANVLLAVDGSPRITDFGLAKHLDQVADLTDSGTIIGTPCYMAPEQAWGNGHVAGPPADVYSLGAILYEGLTGRPPFRGPTVHDILEQARSQLPIPPCSLRPDLPAEVERICLKCLEKAPGLRFPSAGELADALSAASVGEDADPVEPPIVTGSASSPTPAAILLRSAMIVGSLAVGCVIVFLGLLLSMLAFRGHEPAPAWRAQATPRQPQPLPTQKSTAELKGIVIGKPFNNLHQFLAPVGGQEGNFAFSVGARAFDQTGKELDPLEIKRINKAGNVVDLVVESAGGFRLKSIKEIRLIQGDLLPAHQVPASFRLSPARNGEIDYLKAVVVKWDRKDNSLVVKSDGQEFTVWLDHGKTQSNDGTGQQLFRDNLYRVLKEGNVVDIRTRNYNNKATAIFIILIKGKLLSLEEMANKP